MNFGENVRRKRESLHMTQAVKEDLNVRTGAGVGYAVAEKDGAKYNTAYPVYEIKRVGTQDWGRIGTNRWICLAYCATKPIAAATTQKYTITCDFLYRRKSKSTLSAKTGKLYRGEQFTIAERAGNWCKLPAGDWVCAGKYLKKI